jgi:hypothetical protein
MPVIPILNQHPGALPITVSYKSPINENAYIQVSGSVWSASSGVLCGIQVLLDGVEVGTAKIYSNNKDVHRAVVPVFVKAPDDFDPHKLTLAPLNGHSFGDHNDFYTAVLMY